MAFPAPPLATLVSNGAPPPLTPEAFGAPPPRPPYDSLGAIHSLEQLEASASSLTTDVGMDLDSLDETLERNPQPSAPLPVLDAPEAEAPRPPAPALPLASERSGTRELVDIQAPPSIPLNVIQPSPAVDYAVTRDGGSDDDVVELPLLLKRRTRIGSVVTPLWTVALLGLVVVAAMVMLVSSTLTALVARRSPDPAPTTTTTGVAEPGEEATAQTPSEPTEAPRTGLAKARAGDEAALAALEQKAVGQLSTEEALALGDGRRAQRRRELQEMSERLTGKEPETADVALLREALADGEVAFTALGVMVVMAGPAGPDLLYEAWTRPPQRTPTTALAESLVYSKEVFAKASPALQAALALRVTEDCEKIRAHLATVAEHGDRRSQTPLTRLMRRNGCGQTKRDDCYPCLDKRQEVVDTLQVVRGRIPPRY